MHSQKQNGFLMTTLSICLGEKKMNVYTGVQVLCLIGLFGFKQIPSITIFFPAMIAILMFIRSLILPNFFNEDEFVALGDPTPS
mmetsp:Transcript_26794/g.55117  ORF Transcript_26794/g.55117 Transcript_26794/m.55117 type:complete len:84 (+) Transcript_26794:2166-2417(+)